MLVTAGYFYDLGDSKNAAKIQFHISPPTVFWILPLLQAFAQMSRIAGMAAPSDAPSLMRQRSILAQGFVWQMK